MIYEITTFDATKKINNLSDMIKPGLFNNMDFK